MICCLCIAQHDVAWRRMGSVLAIWATFRTGRDSGTTWLALLGIAPEAMCRRLGHKDWKATRRYVRAAEDLGGKMGMPFPPFPPKFLADVEKSLASGQYHRDVARGASLGQQLGQALVNLHIVRENLSSSDVGLTAQGNRLWVAQHDIVENLAARVDAGDPQTDAIGPRIGPPILQPPVAQTAGRYHCHFCGEVGHNVRTCNAKRAADMGVPHGAASMLAMPPDVGAASTCTITSIDTAIKASHARVVENMGRDTAIAVQLVRAIDTEQELARALQHADKAKHFDPAAEEARPYNDTFEEIVVSGTGKLIAFNPPSIEWQHEHWFEGYEFSPHSIKTRIAV